MKQTAVEWLCNEWLYIDQEFDMKLIDKKTYWERLKSVQEQAKAMEKEQIMKARQDIFHTGDLTNEQYYKKPLNQNKMKEIKMLENKINLLEEDLECVHTYLDDKQVSRKDDKSKVYSIVGRIKRLEENLSHRDNPRIDRNLLLNFFKAGNDCGCMEHENIEDYFEKYYNETFKSE